MPRAGTRHLPDARAAREALVVAGFRTGWRLTRLLPERGAQALFRVAADAATRRGGAGVAQLRANLSRAAPAANGAALDALVAAGMRSYARYWCDAFRLPSWSAARVAETVRTVGEEPVRAALASGRGVVGVLGHLGNWDHAGAWSQARLAPVVTVAERLRPVAVHEQFLAYRRGLGMEVLPHGDPATFGILVRRLRAGAFVPLLADRDLSATGVEVTLLGEPARMAAGPAALALVTGAALVPIGVHYEELPPGSAGRRTGARHGIVITFGAEVVPPPAVPGRAGREEAVRRMTQACADALAATIAEHPQDWHMLQPVFSADVGRRR
ncbi:KDO2-lipid IV(A) lauroyltransferase [Kineococcus xinjiangensis]|uniref:KDO2-lipid IV(A) lauroyltransferase n=1 Tax=Kineococcus xinjiangensis TaxID=512762 RepID=A0A2S6IP60_9ACTN|nr:phosphatidylinositol mannoside acyltransferase [Kineococcus xinjiangensis]PPK95955.1 KDO2-lipid IV(A) lauroyltransferase [Kineococcus xinjiangensis]